MTEKLAKGDLAFLANEEVIRLVLAWRYLDGSLKAARRRRAWAELANVRPHAPKLYEAQLVASGILQPNGAVHQDALDFIAVRPLARQLAAARRGSHR